MSKLLCWAGWAIMAVMAGNVIDNIGTCMAITQGKTTLRFNSICWITPKTPDYGPDVGFCLYNNSSYINGHLGPKIFRTSTYALPVENGLVECYKNYVVVWDRETGRYCVADLRQDTYGTYSDIDKKGMLKLFPNLQSKYALYVVHLPPKNIDYLYTWGLYAK